MNGTVNPNATKMGNFGKDKNYMKSGDVGNVKMEDILPQDPYKKPKGKWLKESEERYETKQMEIAKEQQQFVPQSFKSGGGMNLDIKNNKAMEMDKNKNKNNNINKGKQKQQQQEEEKQKEAVNKNVNNNINNNDNCNIYRGGMEQPIPSPYYKNKAPDPFAAFLNNSEYQRDLKNHGVTNGDKDRDKDKDNKYINGNNYHSGNKESNNWSGIDNKFCQPIRSICNSCGKSINDSWTEDAKQRMYHNQCFICCECGISLGKLGKYVTVGKGVVCKPCRNKQVIASQTANPYQ